MQPLFIPVIEGTTRPNRLSIHAAKLVVEVGKTMGVETMLIDPNDFHLPFDGNDEPQIDPKYRDVCARADAFFIVTPEYNHSIPGSLKRLLDSELKNYSHKPVAFGGVSDGQWGGVRAIEAVVTTIRGMGLVATSKDVQFPFVDKLFDTNGKLLDEKYIERIKRTYRELIWMAQALKWGRENITVEQA